MKELYFLICHTVGGITSATGDADPEAQRRAVTALPTQPSFRQKAASPLPSLYAAVTFTLGDLFKYRKERLINKGVYPEALKQNCFSVSRIQGIE